MEAVSTGTFHPENYSRKDERNVSNETTAGSDRRGHGNRRRRTDVCGQRLHSVWDRDASGEQSRARLDFDAGAANDFGAISFPVPTGATLATLTALSAEFDVTNDDCGGGSPRFQINIEGKNVFVFISTDADFTGSSTGVERHRQPDRLDRRPLRPDAVRRPVLRDVRQRGRAGRRSADHRDPASRGRRLVATGQGADGPRPQGDDQ